jgi:hypothetical protein
MTFYERAIGSPVASESGLGAARDLEREFARAFPAAEMTGAKLNDSLRQAIRQFVDEAKGRGASENDVVISMKALARRSGFIGPESARSLTSFPADRLFTRAITVCLEAYHEADDVVPLAPRTSDTGYDPHVDLNAFRALRSKGDDEGFTRAIGAYVRSAHARGLGIDSVFANVDRILKASDDPAKRSPDDALHSHQLVILGLLLAVYHHSPGDARTVAPSPSIGVASTRSDDSVAAR